METTETVKCAQLSLDDMPDVMSPAQAQKVLGIGRNGTYEAIRQGIIPSVRIGRRILVPKAGLERFLDAEVN